MSGAFDGLRVIELGQIYNGPYCALLLAQLGADVIKVEPPGGERLRFRSTDGIETHEFLMLNIGKRSMVLDLKCDEGVEVLSRLLASADVVIENFAPGTMERLGLSPEALVDQNPGLIHASGKGYGSSGPYASMPAMDITIQAMSGTIATTGHPDAPPVKAGPAFADFLGGVHLFAGIATALYQRERTGQGQVVEVSMHDTMYTTLASIFGGLFNDPDHRPPERTGNRHSGLAVAPYNVYPASDGWVAIISVAENHFRAVMEACGRPELVYSDRFGSASARRRNMDELDAILSAWTSQNDRWRIADLLLAAGVPCAPVLSAAEVARDEHLVERGMVRTVEHPRKGEVLVPGCPIRLGDSPASEPTCAPMLGADTDQVLASVLGLGAADIRTLRDGGVVA